MAATYDDIMKKLAQRQFAPVYILMGEEPFYIDCISDYIENNVMPEADRDFNQVVLYGKDVDAQELIANAKQFPFGSDYRVVIVKEAKDLAKFDQLIPYFENPSSSAILVICYKYGKLKAAQTKACEKHGVVFLSEPVKDYQLAAWVQKQSVEHHFKLSAQTAAIIAEHIGNDLTRINNEFLKMKIILPEGAEITPEIVEKNIGISKEYNIFELQNALGERNEDKAYKICLNFAQNIKENPNIKTIAVLYTFFSKMLAYHLAPDATADNLKRIYGNMNPYVLKINAQYAQRYSLEQLKKIISVLRVYDAKAKGVESVAPDEELLKELIYKIFH